MVQLELSQPNMPLLAISWRYQHKLDIRSWSRFVFICFTLNLLMISWNNMPRAKKFDYNAVATAWWQSLPWFTLIFWSGALFFLSFSKEKYESTGVSGPGSWHNTKLLLWLLATNFCEDGCTRVYIKYLVIQCFHVYVPMAFLICMVVAFSCPNIPFARPS